MKRIILDCEQLRKPFSGIHTYCDCLATALSAQAPAQGSLQLTLYVPPAWKGHYGSSVEYKEWKRLHKFHLPLPEKPSLWHCAIQNSKYWPVSGKVPLLTTVHDVNFMHVEETAARHRFHYNAYKHIIGRSERLVTISEATKKDIQKYFDVDGSRIDVIYNGMDTRPVVSQAPATLPKNPYLLNINRIARNKNIHTLPSLLVGNSFDLYIVGSVEDKQYLQEILSQARRWGVQERIHFTGPVEEAQRNWYLENCTAFLFPSQAEGFGLPVIEALKLYKPVFCSDRTSLPEVGGPCAWYFPHDFDPEGMQDTLVQGLQSFGRGEITHEAIDAHLSRFSWDKAARQYWNIYHQMTL